MKTFKQHLEKNLQDDKFKDLYLEEKKLLEMSLKVHEIRESAGLTQREVADKAHITQQQLSRVENGFNYNMLTFLKICDVLGIELDLSAEAVAH